MDNLPDLHEWLERQRVINASGTMTTLGASMVPPDVADVVRHSLGYFVDMDELQALASRVIARATGAEAGCVSASAAGGICVGVAAAMTGLDLGAAESLPDTSRLSRDRVIIQKGHVVNYGGAIGQNIRLTGAVVNEIGTATHCEPYQVAYAASDSRVAAALFVISHHTVQSELVSLQEFCRSCHEHGVPVIVDAASEYDLRTFIELGADLVIYSGHKFLSGPTSGIIAGRKDLIQACYMHQTTGLGRPMKVGKEGVVGAIAVLLRWQNLDHHALHSKEYERIARLRNALQNCPSLCIEEQPDPTGNPITRLRVRLAPGATGTLREFADRLRQDRPAVVVRDHHVDNGFFEIDPCNFADGDVELLIERLLQHAPDLTDGESGTRLGPRRSTYDKLQQPRISAAHVPFTHERGPKDRQAAVRTWPDRYEP